MMKILRIILTVMLLTASLSASAYAIPSFKVDRIQNMDYPYGDLLGTLQVSWSFEGLTLSDDWSSYTDFDVQGMHTYGVNIQYLGSQRTAGIMLTETFYDNFMGRFEPILESYAAVGWAFEDNGQVIVGSITPRNGYVRTVPPYSDLSNIPGGMAVFTVFTSVPDSLGTFSALMLALVPMIVLALAKCFVRAA